jgi:putative dimethyl sulfoxide reductase chaperone
VAQMVGSMTEHRENTYRFFAGLCLKAPSELVVGMIRDGSILSLFQRSDEAGASFTWMFEFVRQARGSSRVKEDLEAAYTGLFVLPSGVLPHESVYLDKEKRVGGRITTAVRQFYEKAGTAIADHCIEMPDHLGIELEFMGFLCKMEQQLQGYADNALLSKCMELQRTFLQDHLLKWACRCCDDIIKQAACGFYRAMAHLLKNFLKSEEECILESRAVIRGRGDSVCEISR